MSAARGTVQKRGNQIRSRTGKMLGRRRLQDRQAAAMLALGTTVCCAAPSYAPVCWDAALEYCRWGVLR